MTDTFDTAPQNLPKDPEQEKKRKLWRNLFFVNLCVSLVLMGLFWLPYKFVELNDFLGSSSVEPRRGSPPVFGKSKEADKPALPANMIGTRFAMINATSEETWTYFDFSRGEQVEIFDKSSLEWDMAFRRGKAKTNGGHTNKFGKSGVLDLGAVDYDSVDQVPNRPFVQDTSTKTESENEGLSQWYSYNYITHKLTPRKNVYVFQTANGKFAKVQFTGFYCANKEPGCVQLRYTYQDEGTANFLKPEPVESASVSDESSSAAEASGL